jgi:hypothetical protein
MQVLQGPMCVSAMQQISKPHLSNITRMRYDMIELRMHEPLNLRYCTFLPDVPTAVNGDDNGR